MKWGDLILHIGGHKAALSGAKNMVVTTSDGRWTEEVQPKDIAGLLNQLGEEGWEMVQCAGGQIAGGATGVWPREPFEAVFKRPVP